MAGSRSAMVSRRRRTDECGSSATESRRAASRYRGAGVTRALQPARFGGLELHPLAFYEAISRIGEACASTAWATSILSVHNWQLAMFSPATQQEVWGDDPTTLVSS